MRTKPRYFKDKTEREVVTAQIPMKLWTIGDPIVSVEVTAEPTTLSIIEPEIVDDGQTVEFTMSGGRAGCEYKVKALCTLNSGTVLEPTALLMVVDAGE